MISQPYFLNARYISSYGASRWWPLEGTLKERFMSDLLGVGAAKARAAMLAMMIEFPKCMVIRLLVSEGWLSKVFSFACWCVGRWNEWRGVSQRSRSW